MEETYEDKYNICYCSHYPETLGIRRELQKLKVKRIKRHMLPEKSIELCERDPSKKETIIYPYLKKWEKYLKPCIAEMQTMIAKTPVFNGGYDKSTIQTDILFCRLAYGFIPSEYIAFNLVDKKPDERRQFCSDLDTNVFGYTVNNIVEVQTILNKATSANKYQKLLKRDYLIISNKTEYESFHSFVSNHQVFVKKKVFSSMGKGVELIDIRDIADSEEDYLNKLRSSGTWLLEERVIQRKEMGCFNESSVNTVRCMTFKTRDGIVVPYCFMRTGRNGAFVDNGGSGGLLMGIDVVNGVVDTDALDWSYVKI